MDHVAICPSRRDDRPRLPGRWAARALLGLLLVSSSGTAALLAGELAQTPAASHDGSDSPKAQLASAPADVNGAQHKLDASPSNRTPIPQTGHVEADPIGRARRAIADCKAKYLMVQDYTCTFYKRERIDGKLYVPHVMTLKARTKPASLYFKFIQPNRGREAIFVKGHHNDKIVAHDVGLGRVVAGTMYLDPKGDMAMEENRHPVTEAGLGAMIDLVKDRWDTELHPGESILLFHPQAKVGDRACLMVESIHPKRSQEFLFHKVKLYIDRELNLPIRFEAYDWPKRAGAEPELIEEYTYMNLKTNVGLKDRDFDPKNAQYSYGRF
jgi:outer membrane lipoprotein-sorting protein